MCGKALPFREQIFNYGAAPQQSAKLKMFTISKDSQALYITAVTKDRLPVFQTDAIKTITCAAIDEARKSGGILLFAYVIMPDHLHLLAYSSDKKPSDVLRYIKGIVAHRVIEHLKEKNYESSLEKLRHQDWKRNHRYSLWQHESNTFQVFSESMFMQKANYIHQNPVRAGLVERAIDYRCSSARIWQHCETEDEPMLVDLDQINWHKPTGRA